MSKSILVTRPNYEITTNYLFYWSQPVIKFAQNKGIVVYDLTSSKASKSNVESYLESRKPKIIFFNGHGSVNTIAGQDDLTILTTSDLEPQQFANCIIYARSCQSARELGPFMINHGTETYLGYTEDFIFFRVNEYVTNPLADPIAKYFLEPSNLLISTLLKGHSTEEAHKRSKKAMRKNFLRLLSSNSSADERDIAPYLWSNLKAQVLLGSPTAKL